jgi:hypothetical protein
MELALNLVWLLVTAGLLALWSTQRSFGRNGRLHELLAIAALVIILFPVVSVSDDLQVATNIAETDTTVRRDYDGGQPHSIFPTGVALPECPLHVASFDASVCLVRFPAVVFHPLVHSSSALANRPPPAV